MTVFSSNSFLALLTLLKGCGGLLRDDGSVPVSDGWRHQLVRLCHTVSRDIRVTPGHEPVMCHMGHSVTQCVLRMLCGLDTGQHLLSLVTCETRRRLLSPGTLGARLLPEWGRVSPVTGAALPGGVRLSRARDGRVRRETTGEREPGLRGGDRRASSDVTPGS